MELIHRLRYFQFNSRTLRYLLSFWFQSGHNYTVFFGPLRGIKLRYEKSINFHAILGFWDLDILKVIGPVLKTQGWGKKKMVAADVGANAGLVSLWLNKLGNKNTTIFAFEPVPDTRRLLDINLDLNEAHQVVTVPLACSDRESEMELFIGNHHHQSSLVQEWAWENRPKGESITVKTQTLDQFFSDKMDTLPDLIKVDIEGGGVYALKGCDEIVKLKRPLFWIESHTPEEDGAIRDLVQKHQYSAFRFSNRKYVVNLHNTYPDKEGIWGTLLLFPNEKSTEIKEALRSFTR